MGSSEQKIIHKAIVDKHVNSRFHVVRMTKRNTAKGV